MQNTATPEPTSYGGGVYHTTTNSTEDPVFSPEDADLFQKMMTVDEGTGTAASAPARARPPARVVRKLFLEEHHVILKSKTAPTKATRIWKEHVRFVFGKKKKLADPEIESLKELQDLYYRCTYGGDSTVEFFVEAAGGTVPVSNQVYFLGDVAYVPATEKCLRDEIKNNGVSSHKRRKREPKNPTIPLDQPPRPMTMPPPSSPSPQSMVPPNRFALANSSQWKENVNQICQDWTNESVHWAERVVKRHLVDKLEQDLSKYAAFWEQNVITDIDDDYDRQRQALHSSMLLETVNKLGNGMVDWYDQDYQKRTSKAAAGFSQGPPSGGDGFAGSGSPDQGGSRGGSPPANGGPGSFHPNQNTFNGGFRPSSGGPTEGLLACEDSSSESHDSNSDYEEYDSESFWTDSDDYDSYDPSTSATSLLDDDSCMDSSSDASGQVPECLHNEVHPRSIQVGGGDDNLEDAQYSMDIDCEDFRGLTLDPDDVLWTSVLSDGKALDEGDAMQAMLDGSICYREDREAEKWSCRCGDTRLYSRRQELKERRPSFSKSGLSTSISKDKLKHKESFFQMRLNSLRRIGWWLDKTCASRGSKTLPHNFDFHVDSDDETDGTDVEDLFHPMSDVCLNE